MKICIFSTTFYPQTGGAERVIHNLATHLTDLNLEVFVLVPCAKELKSFRHNYNLLKIHGARFSSDTLLLVNLLYYQLRFNFDVIQAVLLYPPGEAALKLKRVFNDLKIFCRPTGVDIQIMPEIGYGLRLDKKIDSKIRKTLNYFDGLIANSESIKEELIKAGCKEDIIRQISNGLDTARFSHQLTDIRERLSLPRESKVILSVGRVHPKKNYHFLLRVFKKVLDDYKNVYLVVVGGGEEVLNHSINELGIKDQVILTGQILMGDHTLEDLYLSSNLFVFPSLIEGQPNVLLEAMAAGLPIVAADVPGSRDIVEDGKTGYLVAAGDAGAFTRKILWLLKSSEICDKISAQSKKIAGQYSWDKIAQQYRNFYEGKT